MPANVAPTAPPVPQPAGSAAASAPAPSAFQVAGVLQARDKDAAPPGANKGLEMFQRMQQQNAKKPMVDITK